MKKKLLTYEYKHGKYILICLILGRQVCCVPIHLLLYSAHVESGKTSQNFHCKASLLLTYTCVTHHRNICQFHFSSPPRSVVNTTRPPRLRPLLFVRLIFLKIYNQPTQVPLPPMNLRPFHWHRRNCHKLLSSSYFGREF